MFRDPFLLSTPFLIYNLHLVLQFTSKIKIKIKSSQMAKWFFGGQGRKKEANFELFGLQTAFSP